jgi:hypothetical protein
MAHELRITPDSMLVTPFWRRIPKFFLFPAQFTPMLYLALLAGVSLLVSLVPMPWVIILGYFFAWLGLLRYAYTVLEQTALGRLRADSYSKRAGSDAPYRPYKQFLAFVLMGIALGFVQRTFGNGAAIAFYIAMSVSIPANVMVLAMTNSVFSSVNPVKLLSLINKIGLPYFTLCFFLILLSGGSNFLVKLLAVRVPMWLLLPLINFVSMYFTLIMFNMMGYVLYQYHDKLGLELAEDAQEVNANRTNPATGKPVDRLGEQVGELIAEGNIKAALDLAYEDQRQHPDQIVSRDRYHKVLMIANNPGTALRHAQDFISLLVQKHQLGRALQVFLDCQGIDPAFRLDSPVYTLKLAETARTQHKYELALNLLRSFEKSYGKHPDLARAYLLMAQIQAESLSQDAQALSTLDTLLQKCSDSPLVQEAMEYRQVIKSLQQPRAA